jgi:hypothetical protein
MFQVMKSYKSYNNILSNLLLHILQKEKIATKIAAKIARVNGPLGNSEVAFFYTPCIIVR